jgi:UDP-glucose 4-epimerase
MSVLIVGGTGYVGARMALHLAQTGTKVVIASRQPQLPAGLAHANISLLGSAAAPCDAIIMLAAANEQLAAHDPYLACSDTTLLCARWMAYAKTHAIRRFIYFSTVHVYGAPTGILSEQSPTRSRHAYADTHLAAEILLQGAHRRGELDALIFRLSNAYGAPAHPLVDRWSLLLNDLAKQGAKTGHMQLQSDGRAERDFIALEDVCNAVQCLLHQKSAGAVDAPVLNLASGQSSSLWCMAEALQQAFARAGKTCTLGRAADSGDPVQPFLLSIDALKAAGFAPKNQRAASMDLLAAFALQHFAQVQNG